MLCNDPSSMLVFLNKLGSKLDEIISKVSVIAKTVQSSGLPVQPDIIV